MTSLPEYKAGKATTCNRLAQSGIVIHHVRLPDGRLIDCGPDPLVAELVCDCINVLLKWSDIYPPVGVIEDLVRNSLLGEERRGEHGTI